MLLAVGFMGFMGFIFCLALPGSLATAVFVSRARPWERVLLGALIGTFCMPFLCFAAAMILGTVMSWTLLLGTATVVNLTCAACILVTRHRRIRKSDDAPREAH